MRFFIFLLFLVVVVVVAIFVVQPPFIVEGLQPLYTNNGENRCPNLLLQKGTRFLLYNTTLAEVPGVNPVEFNHLQEYVEFLEWQRSVGIRCPVLYMQEVYTADGKRVYKVRPSVTEPQMGLPSMRSNTSTNSTNSTTGNESSGNVTITCHDQFGTLTGDNEWMMTNM